MSAVRRTTLDLAASAPPVLGIVDALPRVKLAGPKNSCAVNAPPPDEDAKPVRYTQVPHDVLALRDVSDAAKIAWAAMQKWTWREAQPSNAQLADACGWITPSGAPSLTKVKLALRELEAAGLITRVGSIRDGWHVRDAIEVHQTVASQGGRLDSAHPWAKFGLGGRLDSAQGGRLDSAQGGRLDSALSEDRCRKTREDSQRSGSKSGSVLVSTTTTKAKSPDPEPVPQQFPGEPFDLAEIGKLSAKPAAPKPVPVEPSAEFAVEPVEVPPPLEPLALTEGQRNFLENLPADRRERFDAMPLKLRDHILSGFAHGPDRAAQTEADRMLAPKAPPRRHLEPEDPMPTILEAMGRRDAEAIPVFVAKMSRHFNDFKSSKYYRSVGKDLVTGQLSIEDVESALRQATGPKSKDGPKVFVHALKAIKHQRQHPALRAM